MAEKTEYNLYRAKRASETAAKVVFMAATKTKKEIANELGITVSHVVKILHKHNVKSISEERTSLLIFDEIPEEVKNRIISLYIGGKAVCVLSDKTGISVPLINRMLLEANVPMRIYKEEDRCRVCGVLFDESDTPPGGFPFAPRLCRYCLYDICKELGINVIPRLLSKEQKLLIALYVIKWCNEMEEIGKKEEDKRMAEGKIKRKIGKQNKIRRELSFG
jgi:hypothetical protein